MLSAVVYCHQNNIVHRDLKPENILIKVNEGGQLEVKIADLGTSKKLDLTE